MIDDIVEVTIDRQTKLPTQVGFGTPAIFDINTWQATDTAVYTEVQEMLDAGATTSDEAVKAATAVFSQNPRPERLKVLKRAANVAQVNTVTVGGADDGTYTHTLNGEDHSFVASSSTITAIRDALVAAINGGGQAGVLTAAPVSTDMYTVTSDSAGLGFSSVFTSNPSSNLSEVLTTPNTGSDSELARLREIDDDWYFLLSTSRTEQDILQNVASIELLVKLYAFESDQADSKNLPVSTDTTSIFAQIQAANRDRTFYVWTKTSNLENYPAAAWVGLMAPKTPGSATWKFKTVSGPVPDDELTSTERTNIEGKNGNIYITVAGITMFQEGVVASGEFIDIMRGTDLIQARMQENVFFLLVNEDKVPFDNGGIEAVALRVEDTLTNVGVANTILRGGDDAPVVVVPDVNQIAQADRANRFLNEITFTAFYAGAIHKAKISGRITV